MKFDQTFKKVVSDRKIHGVTRTKSYVINSWWQVFVWFQNVLCY